MTQEEETKDWTEDFAYENGNYRCLCAYCGEYFIGHKRRVMCKQCDKDMTEDPEP